MIYHATIDTTRPALERFAAALLLTRATLLPRRLVMGPLGRGVSAVVVVGIPDDQVDRFAELARPIDLRRPPRVAANKPASPRTIAAEVVRDVTGIDAPVERTAGGWVATVHGLRVVVQLGDPAPVVHFARGGMTSEPADTTTARQIFAALCHLGAA